jgi:GntR family transcriptional regulator
MVELRAMNSASPTFSPLYRQIKELVLQSLDAGEWKPGEPIPSEVELSARFGVSQGTVRKAIDELAAENLLVRRQGKGTFVASHSEPVTQFRFLRLHPNEGEREQPESRLLEVRRQRASSEVARALDLKAGESVVYVRRLLVFGGTPIVLDDISLPAALFKGLDAQMLNAHEGSYYGLYEREFGTRMIRAEERIRAVAADAEVAGVLGVERGAPLLCVDRTAYTYGDRPVEFRRGLYRTDQHHYRNSLV